MAAKGLGRVFDIDPSAMRRDDSRDAAVRQVEAKIGDGAKARRIGPIALVATVPKDTPHLLGREIVGWRVADITGAGATIYRGTGTDSTKFLQLVASATTTVYVEVW